MIKTSIIWPPFPVANARYILYLLLCIKFQSLIQQWHCALHMHVLPLSSQFGRFLIMLTQFHHKTTARYYYPAGMLVKKKKMNRTEEDDSRALSIYGSRVAIDLPYTCQCARTWPPPSMKWNRSHLHVSWGEKSYTPSLKKTRNDVFINNEIRTDAENSVLPLSITSCV